MTWRMDAVQVVVAHVVELPAHRIMQRMDAGIAPVAVEAVLGKRRAGASEFEQLVRREDRDLARCFHV